MPTGIKTRPVRFIAPETVQKRYMQMTGPELRKEEFELLPGIDMTKTRRAKMKVTMLQDVVMPTTVLMGWEQIAAYFGVSVSTMMRLREELRSCGVIFYVRRRCKPSVHALVINLQRWQMWKTIHYPQNCFSPVKGAKYNPTKRLVDLKKQIDITPTLR